MCKTKFLRMCSFSIILTSLYSLNLSFPLLSYVISTAITRFPPWFSTSPPSTLIFHIYRISTQIPDPGLKKIVTLVQKLTLSFVTIV